jgi:Na+-driven multidrug efflux pump
VFWSPGPPVRTIHDKVNRTVYQAFLTAVVLSVGVLAPLGYVLSPKLLEIVNATPAVRAEALPFLRTMFVFSIGMLMFFMLGGALRAAGDARTPLRLGIAMTVLNFVLNVVLISGAGPVPAFGTKGAAMGTAIASISVSAVGLWLLMTGRLVVHFERGMSLRPDFTIIRALFRFGLPAGIQGVAMNVAGVLLLRFIGSLPESAEAQAAYAVGYSELFSLITWTSVGLMGAAAAIAGQNLGAGKPERSAHAVHIAARFGLGVAATVGALFSFDPGSAAWHLRPQRPDCRPARSTVASIPERVRPVHHGRIDLHGRPPGDRRYAKSALHHAHFAGVASAGICFFLSQTGHLQASGVWTAILVGHSTRCLLSLLRFRQGKWRHIEV